MAALRQIAFYGKGGSARAFSPGGSPKQAPEKKAQASVFARRPTWQEQPETSSAAR